MSSTKVGTWRNLLGEPIVTRSQESLEQQMGATPQPLLPASLNQYCFTSGKIDRKRWTVKRCPWLGKLVPRFAFWIPVATVLVIVSLLGSVVAFVRTPWFITLIGVALSLIAITAPDLVTLLIQAACVACIVLMIHRTVAWGVEATCASTNHLHESTIDGCRNESACTSVSVEDGGSSHLEPEAKLKL